MASDRPLRRPRRQDRAKGFGPLHWVVWHRYMHRSRRTAHHRPTGAGWPLLFTALLSVGFTTLVMGALTVTAFARFTEELPSPEAISRREVKQSTKIYDRTGQFLLYEIADPTIGKRTRVPLRDMPPAMIAATLAAEDKNFYTNPGFDPIAVARALFTNVTSSAISSGASTITQQVVRNTLLPPEERSAQSALRKIKEMILAYFLTQRYSKDEILETYLNEVYYGNLSYGVGAAAENYFGKSIRDITIAEAALIAGMPQAPSAYNPYVNPEAAKQRQFYVIARMVEQEYLTPEQGEAVAREPLKYYRPGTALRAPHFVFYVRDLLEQKYGRDLLITGGLRVITTLDLRMQEIGEFVVRRHVDQVKKRVENANNGSLVALDPTTAEIVTMVGSADYYDLSIDGQVNVTTALRQPGSTIKPVTYALAFTKGWTPATIVLDAPIALPDNFGTWVPQNYDGQFHGTETVRAALGNSHNIPAIKALQYVGIKPFMRLAREMGITTYNEDWPYGLSIAIGGGEVRQLDLAAAYSVFATGGLYREPVAIREITDADGRVLERYDVPEGKRVLPEQAVYMVTDILTDSITRLPTYGPNSALDLTRPAAAKTGTTDESKDLWVAGYTPDLVAVVWVGNTQAKPTERLFGGMTSGPIWHDFMEAALLDRPATPFKRPKGVDDGALKRPPPTPTPMPTPRPAETLAPNATPTPAPTPKPEPTPEVLPNGRNSPYPPVPWAETPNVIGLEELEARRKMKASGALPAQYANYINKGDKRVPEAKRTSVCIGCVIQTSPPPGERVSPLGYILFDVRNE